MCGTEGIQAKQQLIADTYDMINRTLLRVRDNLQAAKGLSVDAGDMLRENLNLTRACIASIRQAVARLKEA